MKNGFKYYAYYIANNNSIFSDSQAFASKKAALKWVLDCVKVEHFSHEYAISNFFVKNKNGLSIFEGEVTGINARVRYYFFNGIVRI